MRVNEGRWFRASSKVPCRDNNRLSLLSELEGLRNARELGSSVLLLERAAARLRTPENVDFRRARSHVGGGGGSSRSTLLR